MKINTKTTIQNFQELEALSDFAALLGFAPKTMSFILYKLGGGPNGQYKNFEIKKRSGGIREIASPDSGLKGIQCWLCLFHGREPCNNTLAAYTVSTWIKPTSAFMTMWKATTRNSIGCGKSVESGMRQWGIALLSKKKVCVPDVDIMC